MKVAGMEERCGRDGGITFHSLRHTFGTRAAAAGVPMRTLQEWMGHRNIATTEIYADYAPDPAFGAEFAERMFTARKADGEENGGRVEGREAGEAGERDAAIGEESGVDDAA